jgi:hypothetical protein
VSNTSVIIPQDEAEEDDFVIETVLHILSKYDSVQ